MDIGIGVPQDNAALTGNGTVIALLKAIREQGSTGSSPTGAVSGKKAVTTAGTAVALGSGAVGWALAVKANVNNTGVMYVGNNGAEDVSSSDGFELGAGDVIIFDYVADLSDLWVDASVNGEGVSWLILRT